MLTADLSQSWYRNGRTGPRYVDTTDEGYLRDAEALIHIFNSHEGRERAELDAALDEYVGTGTDYKIMRGLIKLLSDRCTFATATAVEPSEIRRALFLKAREFHPLSESSARAQTLSAVALELDCPPEQLLSGLYADLPEKQRLVEFESLGAGELLDLYNLAQAQALLYRCVEMLLWVKPQAPESYRELFSAIKAYRLIHTIKGSATEGYEIRLDGPVSIFHRSQKYGIQMAVFLPALLVCQNWRLRAEITMKPGARSGGPKSAYFELDSQQHQLRSSYVPTATMENRVQDRLLEKWAEHDSAWTLERSNRVIDLGESAFIPDFVVRHSDGEEFYLEVLGFWTPRYLQARLKEFEHAGIKNYILAAWDELRGSRDPLIEV
ncbi:MAG: DUF790 family protein, partial [Pyrinomonadaceae bacterium]|nr:DUF790 family protein [Pyrinomonadaceae bacterium]